MRPCDPTALRPAGCLTPSYPSPPRSTATNRLMATSCHVPRRRYMSGQHLLLPRAQPGLAQHFFAPEAAPCRFDSSASPHTQPFYRLISGSRQSASCNPTSFSPAAKTSTPVGQTQRTESNICHNALPRSPRDTRRVRRLEPCQRFRQAPLQYPAHIPHADSLVHRNHSVLCANDHHQHGIALLA